MLCHSLPPLYSSWFPSRNGLFCPRFARTPHPADGSPVSQSLRQTAGFLACLCEARRQVRRTTVRLRATPCSPWSCAKILISESETRWCPEFIYGWALVDMKTYLWYSKADFGLFLLLCNILKLLLKTHLLQETTLREKGERFGLEIAQMILP